VALGGAAALGGGKAQGSDFGGGGRCSDLGEGEKARRGDGRGAPMWFQGRGRRRAARRFWGGARRMVVPWCGSVRSGQGAATGFGS
jgi:hypothetical protein